MQIHQVQIQTARRAPGEKLRLLHAADLHLGFGWGPTPEQSSTRRREVFRAWERLLDQARQEGTHLILLAGDILEADTLTESERKRFQTSLQQAPCPVLLTPGNHDPYQLGSPYLLNDWPENLLLFPSEWTGYYFPDLNATVWGVGFTSAQEPHSLLPTGCVQDWCELCDASEAVSAALPIGILHGQLIQRKSEEGFQANQMGGTSSSQTMESYNPILTAALHRTGLRYVALGHVHRRSGLQHLQGEGVGRSPLEPVWAYSGCLVGNGFDELGPKGCLSLTLSEERLVEAEFLPMTRSEFRSETLEIPYQEDPYAVAHACIAELNRRDPEAESHLYRLALTGEWPVDRAFSWEQLTDILSARFSYLKLMDRTRLALDVQAMQDTASLRGAVLRLAQKECDRETDPEKKSVQDRALSFLLRALVEPLNMGENL